MFSLAASIAGLPAIGLFGAAIVGWIQPWAAVGIGAVVVGVAMAFVAINAFCPIRFANWPPTRLWTCPCLVGSRS